jgi:hypothetical protein
MEYPSTPDEWGKVIVHEVWCVRHVGRGVYLLVGQGENLCT